MVVRLGRTVRALLAVSLLLGATLVTSVIVGSLPASATTVVQTIGVGTTPWGVSSDGTHVWVTNLNDDTVSELSASTGAVVQTIGVGTSPYDVSSDGTHVWVTNSLDNTVSELSASTGAVVQTIGVGSGPWGVSSNGTHVWVANSDANTVSELSASTGAVLQTIPLGGGMHPYGVSSDGTHVWVANYSANTVSELSASTGAVLQTIGVDSNPQGVSSDGTHVWVANLSSSTVSEIAPAFAISMTPALPSATRGVSYGPVSLQAVNVDPSTSPYATTVKWKKVTLPKGLKLSSAGVLSGTPSSKLAAGPSSVTVQVTETVTTVSGKKVKTKTTVQATIPLTIN